MNFRKKTPIQFSIGFVLATTVVFAIVSLIVLKSLKANKDLHTLELIASGGGDYALADSNPSFFENDQVLSVRLFKKPKIGLANRIKNLGGLKEIVLIGIRFDESDDEILRSLSSLKYLRFEDCDVSSSCTSAIAQFDNLRVLSFVDSSVEFSGEELDSKLTTFQFSRSNTSGLTKFLPNIYESLQSLDISYSSAPLKDVDFAKFKNLSSLNISGLHVSQNTMTELCGKVLLSRLVMADCSFEKNALTPLNKSKLKFLILRNVDIADEFVNFPQSLEGLDLSYSVVPTELFESISSLKNLKVLKLRMAEFSLSCFVWLRSLSSLRELELTVEKNSKELKQLKQHLPNCQISTE